MANIVIWIPHEKSYVVVDLEDIEYYRFNIPLSEVAAGCIKQYVAVSVDEELEGRN